ncbi:hypothetical protein AA309_11055 [Microvirga vignae]|uniref:Uncharacterized protein n=1 Tax=Microvirga vignae TaxID=1225564 RepID=A0A0H1RD08_9HYPH|nr:hypothetical protein AA309_11055 [Microvirga vignae]
MFSGSMIIDCFYSSKLFVDGNHNLLSSSKYTAVFVFQAHPYEFIELLGLSIVAGNQFDEVAAFAGDVVFF